MRKFQKYFLKLTNLNFELRKIRNTIKKSLRDSTNNNRTLSVNQVLRFFSEARASNGFAKQAHYELVTAYDILKPHIKAKRKRTDAIDMGELVAAYRTVVMEQRRLRKTIGRRLGR